MDKKASTDSDHEISINLDLNYQVSDCYYKREMKNIFHDTGKENEPDSTDACLR